MKSLPLFRKWRRLPKQVRLTFYVVAVLVGTLFLVRLAVLTTGTGNDLPYYLFSSDAARFASTCANQECYERFERRPFQPSDYRARRIEGRWVWGKLDPAGKGGFSAKVSFEYDGSDLSVDVYYSSDLF